jgi:hypothetical protein
MQNMKAVLQEAGMTFEHIVKTTIFIIDMSDFAKINTVYGSYFKKTAPARETVQVSCLPKNVNINFYDCNSITTSIITEQLLRLWLLAHCEHQHTKQHVYIYFMSMASQRIFEERTILVFPSATLAAICASPPIGPKASSLL